MSVQNNDPPDPDDLLTDVQALMISSKACRCISTGEPLPATFDKGELLFAADWLGTMSSIFSIGGQACQSIATGQPEADTLDGDDLTGAYSVLWLLALMIETGRANPSSSSGQALTNF